MLEKILTEYWSQVALLLAFIGYFGKRILDNISKKREINHSLFQEKRLTAVNKFFNAYSESTQMWFSLVVSDILHHRTDPKELDEIIYPSLNKLKSIVKELQIYFDLKDAKLFDEILDNSLDINQKLFEMYFQSNEKYVVRSNSFLEFRDQKLKSNEEVFKKISKRLKKTFN